MTHLKIDNVIKSYDGRTRAVDGVSLDIAKGEFMTFLGPSGSGKTTTLMMVAGFERPTGGAISIGGRPIDPVPPHRRNIGMVFQNYALFPHMSVERNVGYPLRMRRQPSGEMRRRVAQMLQIVGLSAFAASEPRHLSGGQQQRVALARALVFEPDVLLLDEPLGALDKNLREQMQIEIKRIHRELGVTTVYVTHDQTEAMTMSDRIAVFNAGRVEQVSPPMDIYRRPQTRFVASFVGENNVLDATVSESKEGRFHVENVGIINGVNCHLPKNAPVHIAVRPEVIRRSSDEDVSSQNRFFLKVSGVVNYGDSILLHGTINGQPMRVRLSATDAASIRDGEGLWIRWLAEDVHVLHSVKAT
jgi:putative spermidine/putrescine transport system ATP-binding protein